MLVVSIIQVSVGFFVHFLSLLLFVLFDVHIYTACSPDELDDSVELLNFDETVVPKWDIMNSPNYFGCFEISGDFDLKIS